MPLSDRLRNLAIVLVVAGCHHGATRQPAPASDVPEVRFAIASGKTVQILRTTSAGLVVERTTPVPALVSRMFWVGPDPAVWLDMSHGQMGEGFPQEFFDEPPTPPGPHQNEMGLVTAAGFVTFEPITWPPAARPTGDFADDMTEVTEPNAALVASADALWQRRCRWYGGPDGGWCAYEYARRDPAPVVFAREIKEQRDAITFPSVAPSPAIALTHSTRKRDPSNEDADDWQNNQPVITCKQGSTVVVHPPASDRDHEVDEQVVWLSTEPPVFRTTEAYPYAGVGRAPPSEEKLWEGCALSARYDAARVGPHGIVVLAGRELSVLWRGREIGHLATGGSHPVFAPR